MNGHMYVVSWLWSDLLGFGVPPPPKQNPGNVLGYFTATYIGARHSSKNPKYLVLGVTHAHPLWKYIESILTHVSQMLLVLSIVIAYYLLSCHHISPVWSAHPIWSYSHMARLPLSTDLTYPTLLYHNLSHLCYHRISRISLTTHAVTNHISPVLPSPAVARRSGCTLRMRSPWSDSAACGPWATIWRRGCGTGHTWACARLFPWWGRPGAGGPCCCQADGVCTTLWIECSHYYLIPFSKCLYLIFDFVMNVHCSPSGKIFFN